MHQFSMSKANQRERKFGGSLGAAVVEVSPAVWWKFVCGGVAEIGRFSYYFGNHDLPIKPTE